MVGVFFVKFCVAKVKLFVNTRSEICAEHK